MKFTLGFILTILLFMFLLNIFKLLDAINFYLYGLSTASLTIGITLLRTKNYRNIGIGVMVGAGSCLAVIISILTVLSTMGC